MCLVPDNCDPQYSVEELNSCQNLITETTAQSFSLSVRLHQHGSHFNRPIGDKLTKSLGIQTENTPRAVFRLVSTV